ncbi:hypothetical protein L873DRAFT_666699 [Choiromyces venosus 120613-1]|uniref:Uncharacterized protein n=1 Tax=Choiromyces venosus 120613-1 TaxID=1336337 RepID=A0A3N4IU86_9PEZI|nr:hypothetical protein L873DRAFT_666699 [Choiromyces venosus 120613-1]
MFTRNIQASVPRTHRTLLLLQNRQFSVSSIAGEESNPDPNNTTNNSSSDNNDKPKALKIPVDISSLLRIRRTDTSPGPIRRVNASAEDVGLDSPGGSRGFERWDGGQGRQGQQQNVTSGYFSRLPPGQGPPSDQGPRIIAPRGGFLRGRGGFGGVRAGGGFGVGRGGGRGGFGMGRGGGARGARGRGRGRGRGRRGGDDENASSSRFARVKKSLPPPPELPESVYSPASFGEADLMGYVPATQLTVKGGVSSGLLDKVPVTENTKGWSTTRWQEYQNQREKAAKGVVAGEYHDPAADVGPYREVHRLITVNGSYTDKAKGRLFAEVKRNVPIELIPPPPGQAEKKISAGEGN